MSSAIQAPAEATQANISSSWATTPLRYFLISIYWLPISLFWGMMLNPILPARVADFAGTFDQGAYLGKIAVIGALTSALIQLFIGPISDHCRAKWGRRRPFLLIGTLGGIAGMLSFAWSHSFVVLTLSYFIIQLFLNIANGPYQALIPDHVPPAHQGMASAWMGIMRLIGEAGGPILSGILLDAANKAADPVHARFFAVEKLLFMDVALFAVCVIPALFLVPDEPAPPGESWEQGLAKLFQWDIRGNASFFWLLASRTVYNVGFYVALLYLTYYVRDSLHFGKAYAGPNMIIMICAIGGALLSTLPAGGLADRKSKKWLVYVSCGFSAIATLAFALAPSYPFAIGAALAFGVGWGLFCAVNWALCCNVLPEGGGAAKFMAIWSLSATLPQVAAPAFGPVADAINRSIGLGAGWRAAMIIAALSVVGGATLMKNVVEKKI